MQFCANKLDKKDFFGKSDPFMVFYRSNEDGTWVSPLRQLPGGEGHFGLLKSGRRVRRSKKVGTKVERIRLRFPWTDFSKQTELGRFYHLDSLRNVCFGFINDLHLQVHHLPQDWGGEEHIKPCVAALLHPCQSPLQWRLWQVGWVMMYNKVLCTHTHALLRTHSDGVWYSSGNQNHAEFQYAAYLFQNGFGASNLDAIDFQLSFYLLLK